MLCVEFHQSTYTVCETANITSNNMHGVIFFFYISEFYFAFSYINYSYNMATYIKRSSTTTPHTMYKRHEVAVAIRKAKDKQICCRQLVVTLTVLYK